MLRALWRCPPRVPLLRHSPPFAFSSRATRPPMSSATTSARTGAACSLAWKDDAFGGAIVESSSCPDSPASFAAALKDAVHVWREQGKRGIWLKLRTEQAALVPSAVQLGFDFHHADPGHVMMTLWLSSEPSTLPPNASHQVGVGALVLNQDGNMLAVQECNGPLKGRGIWKMPTGLVHAGEDLSEAVEREVLEETGVRAKFDSVLLMRQAHGFAFGKSDMFVLCALRPEPGQDQIVIQESEIEAACWLPLSQYAAQENFHSELHAKITERCIAYSEGRYKGLRSSKLQSASPSSQRKREDVLVWGDEGEAEGEAVQGSKM